MKTFRAMRSFGLGLVLTLAVSAALDGAEPPQPASDDPAVKAKVEEVRKALRRAMILEMARGSAPGKFAKDPDLLDALEDLRRRHPYESLGQRLAYETERIRQEPKLASAPRLADDTAKQLDELERQQAAQLQRERRVELLRLLHANEVEQFIARSGFGLERVPNPKPRGLDLTPVEPIPLATVSPLTAEDMGVATVLPKTAVAGASRMPSVEQLDALHRGGLMSFLNPNLFGHVKEHGQVAGFEPHQFRAALRPEAYLQEPAKTAGGERWQLKRLELVGLLKHDQPAVYVSEHLPRMDQLAKAKVRSLSAFEEAGLKALRDGEQLKTEATTNVIRMVGALRATKQCLECHVGERGTLLGAFTYEMQRDPPLPLVK
ncbi:MAG: hypothetical protein JNM56_06740 [Planctomycetia bacterium]|nr:hypothetical protein [Planctomycetia bacterium]